MKIIPSQQNTNSNIKFTSLYGELPQELSKFQNEFSEFANNFMKDKPGYDVVISTIKGRKNILKLKMKGTDSLLGRSTNKKKLSEIKSLNDLKDMLSDNYSGTRSILDTLEGLSKIIEPYKLINKI